MMNFIESQAGRLADRIQSIGAAFDPDLLSLPGGSAIALILWAWTSIARHTPRIVRRAEKMRASAPRVTPPAACAGCCGLK